MRTSWLFVLAALLPIPLGAQIVGGRVVDSASKRPLADVKVTALDVESSMAVAERRTDTTGVFYIQLPRSGAYHLKFDVVPTTLILHDTLHLAADDFVEREFILALPADPIFFEFQVDKQTTVKPGTASLRYPDALRSANISGTVLVQFVVDQKGLVEPSSIRILMSTDRLFSSAVTTALNEMRFKPAEFRGKPVRQFVQQPFSFCLTSETNPDRFPRDCGP